MLTAALLALTGPAGAQDAPATEAPAAEEAPKATARTYALDASSSVLAVLVKYDRNALIGGHDHVVQATSFDGTVTWNPDDPSACDVKISFPVTALQVDPPGSRERAGLEGSTSEGDRGKIRNNALGKHQLQSDLFPSISFQSTGCKADGDRFDVTGELSIHGVKSAVTSKMAITVDGDAFSARGTFASDHSTWGMAPYTAALGTLRNAAPLQFTVDVKGAAK